jgi:hypothetical protein
LRLDPGHGEKSNADSGDCQRDGKGLFPVRSVREQSIGAHYKKDDTFFPEPACVECLGFCVRSARSVLARQDIHDESGRRVIGNLTLDAPDLNRLIPLKDATHAGAALYPRSPAGQFQ